MNLRFNLPPGASLADIDPEDLDEQQAREEERAERDYERHRDREMSDRYRNGRDE